MSSERHPRLLLKKHVFKCSCSRASGHWDFTFLLDPNIRIEFRDCDDVSIVLDTYSTLSLPPGPLFRSTTSSSTLLFADLSTELIGVHRLDCSGSKPRLVGRKIDIPLKWKYNMCYASGDGKSLLGVAYPYAVYVYNTQQSRVEWNHWCY